MNLRDEILHYLINHRSDYTSGAALADHFHVSRTAIWKVIEQLKADGADISAVTRRGYQLHTVPDVFCEPHFTELVKNCAIPWNVQSFPEVTSTNDVAKSQAAKGAPEGTVILADLQTAGKGRSGKQFHSPKGSLYMSLILRPQLPLSDMMAVTACTASAVHQALAEFGITAQIKWVNDLFLNGRKICGILSEGSFNAELLQMDYLVIGIGINLRPDPNLPEELRPIVTDLLTQTGQNVSRFDLAASILRQLDAFLPGLPQRTYLPVYTLHSMTIGRNVRVRGQAGEIVAKAIGYTEDAGLIVTHDGMEEVIRTGSAVFVD